MNASGTWFVFHVFRSEDMLLIVSAFVLVSFALEQQTLSSFDFECNVDFDNSTHVDVVDLSAFLVLYGSNSTTGDFDESGRVDIADLGKARKKHSRFFISSHLTVRSSALTFKMGLMPWNVP